MFSKNSCSIINNELNKWESTNSTVTSSPIIHLNELFGENTNIQTATSLVSIKGYSGEPLHYHTSHVLGIVIKGKGWLRILGENQQKENLTVGEGDIAIIPRGVLHSFECEPSSIIEYIALEVSDTAIDYQKHHLEDD